MAPFCFLGCAAHHPSCLKPILSVPAKPPCHPSSVHPALRAPGSGQRKGGRLRPLPFPPGSLQHCWSFPESPGDEIWWGCCCGNHSSFIDGLRTRVLKWLAVIRRFGSLWLAPLHGGLCPRHSCSGSGWGMDRAVCLSPCSLTPEMTFSASSLSAESHPRSLRADSTPTCGPGCGQSPSVHS